MRSSKSGLITHCCPGKEPILPFPWMYRCTHMYSIIDFSQLEHYLQAFARHGSLVTLTKGTQANSSQINHCCLLKSMRSGVNIHGFHKSLCKEFISYQAQSSHTVILETLEIKISGNPMHKIVTDVCVWIEWYYEKQQQKLYTVEHPLTATSLQWRKVDTFTFILTSLQWPPLHNGKSQKAHPNCQNNLLTMAS